MPKGRSRKIGPREPNGRLKRPTRADHEKAVRVLVEARCKRLGVWPPINTRLPSEKAEAYVARERARDDMIRALARTVTLPWMGCEAGLAIAGEEDVEDLWQFILTFRQRRASYLHALNAPPDYADIVHLGDAPPPGDPDEQEVASVDLRDEEERASAAISKWHEITGIWGSESPELGILYRTIILNAPASFQFVGMLRKAHRRLSGIPDTPAVSEIDNMYSKCR